MAFDVSYKRACRTEPVVVATVRHKTSPFNSLSLRPVETYMESVETYMEGS